MKPSPIQQRGAAILIAMLVVTLVATLAAGLQWRQWRLLQQESAARAQSQSAWVLVGALDWARLILREDARSAGNGGLIDHLGEPWALPLQEAKLSSFLSAEALSDYQQGDAYLSGAILDAQSKINLTNLVANNLGQNQVSPASYQTLLRLYERMGLPESELKAWTNAWLAGLQANKDEALRPKRLDQLTWLGVPASSIERLKPHAIILPERTPVNLNTASATVIYAAVPGIDLSAAQKLVQARSSAPLKSISDAQTLLGTNQTLNPSELSVSTQYFEVFGRLRMVEWSFEEASLVKRTGVDVVAVWRRRQ